MTAFLDKIGLPRTLTWGFLGVMIFMIGDGVELTWLSKYIDAQGFNSALLFSVYGIVVALASWMSGVIAETFGVKRTMFFGYLAYLIGMSSFAGIGMTSMNYPTLLITYAIKGMGYPLFAYTFMVWITYRVEKSRLSSAQGWFWFVFTGGLNVLGAYYGVFAMQHFGPVPALFTALVFTSVGTLLALWINKCDDTNLFVAGVDEKASGASKFKELLNGLAIMKREPKVLMGGIVRIINTSSQFAFVVFMPLYMKDYGVDDFAWASIWGSIFMINIVFNLVFGIVGDRIGWGRTVIWFGSIGCAVTVLLFFYAAVIYNNYWFIMLCGTAWSIMLAGFVPLSALVPSLVEKDKGAAVSVLNLGAGLSTFVGPLLVGLLAGPIGYEGVAWVLAGLYVASAVMTHFITPPAGSLK